MIFLVTNYLEECILFPSVCKGEFSEYVLEMYCSRTCNFFFGIYILIWGVFIRVMSKTQGWHFVFSGKERIMIREEREREKRVK